MPEDESGPEITQAPTPAEWDVYRSDRADKEERRKDLEKSRQEILKRFDQAILTLSAGALALSVTFIKEVAPHPKAGTLAWLYSSWAAFIVAIVSVLSCYLSSENAIRSRIAEGDREMQQDSNRVADQRKRLPPEHRRPWRPLYALFLIARDEPHPWGRIVAALNRTSIILFGSAVTFMVAFSAQNLPNEEVMANKSTDRRPTEQKSYDPSPAAPPKAVQPPAIQPKAPQSSSPPPKKD